jgi:hypothetical protein
MTRTLYHVTPRRNLQWIFPAGLMVSMSTGRTLGVWLADADRLPWAVHHIAAHHNCHPSDLSILHCNVNGLALRTIRNGIYVSPEDIPAKRIFDVNYFALGEPA